jgi:hypothetical protein
MAMKRGIKYDELLEEDLDENNTMKDFTVIIATSHTYVKTILYCVSSLENVRDSIQTSVGIEKEKMISSEIDNYVSNVQQNQQKMKVLLEQLQQTVKEAKEQDPVK